MMQREKAEQPWELDEPAAKSHTPEGWLIKRIQLEPSGKAPKHYGPNVYRFGAPITLSEILPRRGWKLVKKTKHYIYLSPPEGEKPPFNIVIAVPPPEECLALAYRAFERGHSWGARLGELPAGYLHERNDDMLKMWTDPTTGEPKTELLKNPPVSFLYVGEMGFWGIGVRGRAGKFALEHYAELESVETQDTEVYPGLITEGAIREVELTKYERSATARKLCLQHYGKSCQICGLLYENKYGSIGAGLIHVHHIVPLAEVGEEYVVDPIKDLVPLCANCHHVVHSRTPPYSIQELKFAIESASKRA